MRSGNQTQLKQLLAVIFAVIACFSLASAQTTTLKKTKKSSVTQLADNDKVAQQQIDQNETMGTRSDLIKLRKKGSLKPKLRKFMTDQQAGYEQSPTPLATQSLSAESLKSDTRFLSGTATVGRATSLYDFQDGTRKDSMDTALKVDMNFWPYATSMRISGGYSRDLRNEEASDFSDTALSLRRSYNVGETFTLVPTITAIAPTSKQSRVADNLEGAMRVGASLGHVSQRWIGWEAGGSLSVGQNFNQYETSVGGTVLSKYVFNQSVSTSYSWKRVGLSVEFVHKNGWTYQGALTEAFEHTEELGFELTKMFSVAVGHTNGGSILRPDGQESNLNVVNETSSMVYGALTMSF
jgi:hypothetical protein